MFKPFSAMTVITSQRKLIFGFVVGVVYLLAAPYWLTQYRDVSPWLWAWFAIWLGLWAWFLYSSASIFDRGLVFIIGSVGIAITCQTMVQNPSDNIKELITQMILVIGGGVGGNYMAHGLLTDEAKRQKKPRRLRSIDIRAGVQSRSQPRSRLHK